jgi:DNA-binding beta-propeller fold protein YncE
LIAKRTTIALALLFFAAACIAAQGQSKTVVPHYKLDPDWPKELPNNWMFGHVESVVVDKDDHIWVLNHTNTMDRPQDHSDMGLAQNPPLSSCCIAAPQVMEFDAAGNIMRAWGGKGFDPEWPDAVHGFWVDKADNVWITGSHAPDRNALKFTPDGTKLLVEIGHLAKVTGRAEKAVPNNQSTDSLGGACGITVDEDAHEVYFADGTINKRVVVFDSDTGAFKRGWGAYGIPLSEVDNKPDIGKTGYDPKAPPDKQFRYLESVRISKDGLVYASDRGANRIQVFTKQGKFVQEFFIARNSLRFPGTAMGFDFSRDPTQKYIYVADSDNNVVWILNRKDGTVVTTIGHEGRNGGQFDTVNSLAVDSKGNLYVTEVKYNNRIQKFVPEK